MTQTRPVAPTPAGSSEEPTPRLRRLAEDLADVGVRFGPDDGAVVEEIDAALHPPVHERVAWTSGVVVNPSTHPSTWREATELDITKLEADPQPLAVARRFADGQSTWLVRSWREGTKWLIFDRPAGSERDLVVIAAALGATLVQRGSRGTVRAVGAFGVLRWERYAWHHEPPIGGWIHQVLERAAPEDTKVLKAMATFAVHDLASRNVGALLIHRSGQGAQPQVEERLPVPPELKVSVASHLAPLRHALAQVDGAAIFDADGTLRRLGVRLVPSAASEIEVAPFGGTRHTSGRRYSYDDPAATVIAVSEDGPVSVLRGGEVLASSVRRRG